MKLPATWLICLAVGSGMLPAPSEAATLRALTDVTGPSIKLGDLFADLPPEQDCILGDAPAAGSQMIIERPQLEAIASQFGVDWTPGPSERTVVIRRAGRTVALREVLALLRQGVDQQFTTGRHSVVLTSYPGTVIDRDAKVDVDGLMIDQTAETFHGFLVAAVAGRETSRLGLSGRVEQLTALPVPIRPIPAGQVLAGADFSIVDVASSRIHGDVIERREDGIGLVSTRLLPAGLPIDRSDLRRPDLVSRGTPVMMRLSSLGIEVDARGQAIGSGSMGEQIRVLNPVAHAVLLATVIGPSLVRIDPDSVPYLPGQAGRPADDVYPRYARVSFGGDGR